MATPPNRVRTIGVHEQLAVMSLVHPAFRCSVNRGTLVCRGAITPTPLCCTYQVRITYRAPGAPRAFVVGPPLRRRKPDECIPHTYKGDHPCLYFPATNEWRPDRRLADTIIPWLSEWLFYYEVWRAIGEWLGGGVHPTRRASIGGRESEVA